jgi:hypothetical protein
MFRHLSRPACAALCLLIPALCLWGCMLDAPLTALAGVLDPDPEHIDDLFGVRFGSPPPPSMERLGTQGVLTAYRLHPAPSIVWGIPVKAVGFLYRPSAGGEALAHISLIAADGIAYARFLNLLQTSYGWPEHTGPGLVWRTATMTIAAIFERGLHTIVFTQTPFQTPHAGIRGETMLVSNRDEDLATVRHGPDDRVRDEHVAVQGLIRGPRMDMATAAALMRPCRRCTRESGSKRTKPCVRIVSQRLHRRGLSPSPDEAVYLPGWRRRRVTVTMDSW